MSLFGLLPGSKTFLRISGKELDKIERKADNLHNSFMPVNVRDDEVDYDTPQSRVAKLIEQFKDQVKRGQPISLTNKTLSSLIDLLRHPNALDDRKHFLEHALVLLSRLPEGDISTKLTNQVTELLYYDLPHPPATYMGDKYRFRTADGSYNNVDLPDLGKANAPYCRSVQAQHPLSIAELPDPQLVYDTLLKRNKVTPHPAGLSNLFFGFATFVIHSIFRTKFQNWEINETSSYVDLAPLYGNNQEKQDAVRTSPKDGRGTLKPDTFAEDRLLFLPPATCALLVLFSRNHNYIANKLLEINEQGKWDDPKTLEGDDEATVAKRTRQDDEIFNTARCINAFWFAQVVFSDYFSCILGLVRDGSSWSLAPFGEIRKDDHSTVERGRGNSCSVEFNILYRWHPTMTTYDEEYIQKEFSQLFDKPQDQITPQDFGTAMGRAQAVLPANPGEWTFGGLTRTKNGSFKDEALAAILKDATSRPANAFGARGSPEVMRVIEVMGIEQARTWGVCSLNDFRRFLQLKPYASFEEWNPDPEIANAARRLYGNIEYLELYPGLQAEQTIPVVPGAGLCPPFTVARAILADAIALTRGDRYFTTDATPYNLTAWGFQDIQRDTTNAGFGSTMGRLFLRTLPNDYTSDSTYTWFPLMTPEAMQTNLKKLGVEKKYKFTRPPRVEGVQPVSSYAAVRAILNDKTNFVNPTVERAKAVLSDGSATIKTNESFLTALNDATVHENNIKLIHSSLVYNDFTSKSGNFFYEKTGALIKAKSFTLSGGSSLTVDIVGDVLQPLTVAYVSEALAGFPLKTDQNPRGIYFSRELQQMLRDVFSYVYLEADPSKLMRAGELAKSHAQQLLHIIKSNLKPVYPRSLSSIFFGPEAPSVAVDYLQNLLTLSKESNKEDISSDVLALVLSSSLPLAQAIINVVDFYLQDANAQHRESIEAVVGVSNIQSDSILRGYVREALRLSPPIQGVLRHCNAPLDINDAALTQGHDVFLGIVDANLDSKTFPDPNTVDPSRPAGSYIGLDDALSGIFTKDFVEHVIAQSLRAVYSLKNVRRGPGSTGTLRRINDVAHGLPVHKYLNINRELSPWTKSMMIQYDV